MNKREKQLLACLRALPEEAAQQLLDFAEFLRERHQSNVVVPTEPLSIPRPEQESVVAAVKRLAATYPMLDKDKLLNETSALVMQHMLQGRDPVAVIDELEQVFRNHYDALS